MKAQSKVYIQLQGIYKAKARKDAAKILEIVQASPGGEHVNPAEVDLFCKNAAFVKLINATGGGASSSGAKISRADRLKAAAGKHSDPPLPSPEPPPHPHHPGMVSALLCGQDESSISTRIGPVNTKKAGKRTRSEKEARARSQRLTKG